MKKLFVTVLSVCMMMLTSVSVFAAAPVSNTYVCPNNNAVCTNNGDCLIGAQCEEQASCPRQSAAVYVCPNGNEACINSGACINNGACTNNEACINRADCTDSTHAHCNAALKRDGSGSQHRGRGHGRHGGNHGC